jgi:hypothetical protein
MDQSQEDELIRQVTPQMIREIGAILRAVRSILIEHDWTSETDFARRVEMERLSPQAANFLEIWKMVFGPPPTGA